MDDLLLLVSPGERGDPMSPLRWTCKSLRRLAAELAERGHRVSHTVVGELLKRCHFSLQANRKTREGDEHPDRDAQFEHINRCVTESLPGRSRRTGAERGGAKIWMAGFGRGDRPG